MKTNICYLGNCLDVLPTLPDNSVDSIVTDPPYELGFMGKSWDNSGIAYSVEMWKECLRVLKPGGHLLSFSGTRTYHRMAVAIEDAGFEVRDMITWNYGQGFPKSLNIKLNIDKQLDKLYTTICQQLPVLIAKNNFTEAHLTSSEEYFVVEGVEQNSQQQKQNAKFVVKNLSKKIAKLNNQNTIIAERYVKDLLKESLENKIKEEEAQRTWLLKMLSLKEMDINANFVELIENLKLTILNQLKTFQNSDTTFPTESLIATNVIITEYIMECLILNTVDILKEINKQLNQGLGTALKPSIEPICFARKPLNAKNISENVLKYGTGGINIDESRVETSDDLSLRYKSSFQEGNSQFVSETATGSGKKMKLEEPEGTKLGRFPANLLHDNSEEVRECFPDTKQPSFRNGDRVSNNNGLVPWNKGRETGREVKGAGFTDTGNASRFFKSILYYPKASKADRNKGCNNLEEKETNRYGDFNGTEEHAPKKDVKNTNFHPTCKPTSLMFYLIKMITPKGGIVLEPFAGSGSTLVAAKDNGFEYIGIEMTEEYLPIIQARTGCDIIKPDSNWIKKDKDKWNEWKETEDGKKELEKLNVIPKSNCPSCGSKYTYKMKKGCMCCEECMCEF